MAGILSLFGIGGRANKGVVPAITLRTQTSVEGRPRPIGAGQNRLSGTVLWYGDFTSKAVTSQSNQGGKGGGGGSGKGAPSAYTYSSSFIVGIGETVAAIETVINGNQFDFLVTPPAGIIQDLKNIGVTVTTKNTYGITFIASAYPQTVWSYINSKHPDQALDYNGESLVCVPNLGLGENPALPNFNFEVRWALNSDIPALGPDANPADWVTAFLTDPDWGAGFPPALLKTLTGYQTWARATSMLISPVIESQTAAQSHLQDLMAGTIADFTYVDGMLDVVPYADTAVTGNGFTYTPNTTPLYDLIESDFMPAEGAGGEPVRVVCERADTSRLPNLIPVSYADRSSLYNPKIVSHPDDPSITAKGPRPADVRTQSYFCFEDAASASAALQMRRVKVINMFTFTLAAEFVLIAPMDILTLTDGAAALTRQPVRVKNIKRNSDGSWTFRAEEYLGNVGAPKYKRQRPLGAGRNNNQDPGAVATPLFFEPYESLSGGLEVFCAVTGANLDIWGGAQVWVATEAGGTYQKVGTVQGGARMGVLTAPYASVAAVAKGQTIDNTNTLSVDLSMSNGALATGSSVDMTSLNTACYVDGEFVAYQTATLVSGNLYNLKPNVRGAYDTAIATHAAGANFARVDGQIVRIPFTQDRVGQNIFVKFLSFNIYGGGLQELSEVGQFTYKLKGTALASPLANITNIRANYRDRTSTIVWDEVTDFRNVLYEIRRGTSWDTGQYLGRVAHPPFTTFGDGTYWVKARVNPLPGLVIYSPAALSEVLIGTVLPNNISAQWDEPGTSWAGTIDGPGAIVGGDFVTTASGSVVYYLVPPAHWVDVLYSRPTRINSTWAVVGVPLTDNFLANPDILNDPDILVSTATQFVDSWVEVYIFDSTAPNDIFAPADIFSEPDIFSIGSALANNWKKYTPGAYLGEKFAMRLAMISNDPTIQAVAVAWVNTFDVPTRVDHHVNVALGTGGSTITNTPDGSATAVAFQGGPNGATTPAILVAIQDQVSGDYFTLTSVTLSSFKIQCFNAGVGVARTVNIAVEGF